MCTQSLKGAKFLSIIVATYNAKINLQDCVESIICQKFTDYELLISDGGSNDGTIEYISSGSIMRLSWFKSSPDNGIYDALNIALNYARGTWVLILGADDRLTNKDSLMQAYLEINSLNTEVNFVYSDIYSFDGESSKLKKYDEFDEFCRQYKGGAFIHHQTAFIKLESIINAGKFSLKYKVHSDYDLMLNIMKSNTTSKIKGAYVKFNSNGFSSRIRTLFTSFCEVWKIRYSHGFSPMPRRLLITYLALLIRRVFPFVKI